MKQVWVYVVERGQVLPDHTEWELQKVFSSSEGAIKYIKKVEDKPIPESEYNPDYEYDDCKYDYHVEKKRLIGEKR